jgi:hypothetical protein
MNPGLPRTTNVAYFCGEGLVELAVELVFDSVELVAVPFFFTFFLCTFLVLEAVAVSLEVEVFCAFFAAVGAAIRNGTAATVRRVEVNSFFMLFSLVCGGGPCSYWPRTTPI